MDMEPQEVREVVIVAVSKHLCSISALEWALANIGSKSAMKLLHVLPTTGSISTPTLVSSKESMGDLTSAHNAGTYNRSFYSKKKRILQAHKELCDAKKVQAEIVLVEGDHVASSLVEQALRLGAKKLIVGRSTKNILRKLKGPRTSDIIKERAARFCTVFVISNGKPVSIQGPGESSYSRDISISDRSSVTVSASTSSSELLSYQQTGSSYVSSVVQEESLPQGMRLDAVTNGSAQQSKQPMVDVHVVREELIAERLSREEGAQSCKDVGDEASNPVPICDENINSCQQAQMIYRKYDFDELRTATNDFAEENKIGKGGYGSVYKGKLDHTKVAIKVLERGSFQGPKEFQQEVDFLGHMRHPHIIILLGASPERRCLVYEYLANGSLEDRLQCKDNTPPLPWHTRFRIAAEVATALLFLHTLKPNPYVHRDVKPQNILLDSNLVSKLGDVGLTALAPSNISYDEINYQATFAVGTPPYMDPAYCMTGTFSPRSDVYGYGLVVLRLLTGKNACNLRDLVEEALNGNSLEQILDPTAGDWPIAQATELVWIATRCCKFRPSDRTDFEAILPQLERLAIFADAWSKQRVREVVPKNFVCPISKAIMKNPYIAADCFTYELAAIQRWLQEHERSPLTRVKLGHKDLIPNHTLRMAIIEWKQRHSSM